MWNSLFWSLFVGTFILEDVALASMLAFVARGDLSMSQGFFACFLGISIGDFAIYYFGRWMANIKQIDCYPKLKSLKVKIQKISPQSMFLAVTICRIVPGTRVVTYLSAGFQKFSQLSFLYITIISVAGWVGVSMLGAQLLKELFLNNIILSIVLSLLFIIVLRKVFIFCTNPLKAQIFLNGLRRWGSFEFWPPWFFYPPLIFYILYLMIKFRSITVILDANPQILYGGLIGESKWDFYQHILNDPFSISTYRVSKEKRFNDVQEIIDKNLLKFPFILKPDVGQRGFAVRIIRDFKQLSDYLKLADFDLIAQEYCSWQNEAGIFYIRMPNQKLGFLFSITDKTFPFVIGDGKKTIAQLILSDKRARIIAKTYIDRASPLADNILKENEIYYLSECGNHCQGAIFKNGFQLVTPQLTETIDQLAKKIPHFYFGRFDIRYESKEKLMLGQSIQIIEVNGAGSEATHIWDPKMTYIEAYKTLFLQWRYLFQVGQMVRSLKLNQNPSSLFGLSKAYYKMLTQKKELQSSS